MTDIAPFKGLTYNFNSGADLSKLVAPPYDVISTDEQESYYKTDPHNIIRLILGRKMKGDSDWDNKYTRASEYFRKWESQETLIHAEKPCIYLTSMTYDPGTGEPKRTRWGLIALVRIEEEDSGVILPHEKTFSAHKDDRLKLMRSSNAQFSQIFGLYEDKNNVILNACKNAMDISPQIAFNFKDGSKHEMWSLDDPALFKIVADTMRKKRIFIADGHHRYETSRNYRNIMRTRYGMRPANRSYDFVMMYLSNMDDKGLTILPSHRLIKQVSDFRIKDFLKKIEKNFEITSYPVPEDTAFKWSSTLKQKLRETGTLSTAIGLYHNKSGKYYLFSLKQGAGEKMADDIHPSLKKLDVIILSRLILQEGLGFSREDLDNDRIFHYQSDIRTAVSQVQSGDYEMAFLLNHTRLEHVKEIASNSLIMPRKSTYFYPKVITGLVINKIDPHEIIQVP